MYDPNACPVCQQSKPSKWDMCRACLRIYGGRSEWPEWLVDVVRDERRLRYRTERARQREIAVPPELMGEELSWPEQLLTRTAECMALSGGVLLPTNPYGDPELDRQYRASHKMEGSDGV